MNENRKILKKFFLNKDGTTSRKVCVEKRVQTVYPKIYELLLSETSFLSATASFNERIFCIKHDILQIPKCVCGKSVQYSKAKRRYKKYCGDGKNSDCAKKGSAQNRRLFYLDNYGVENVSQLSETKEKKKQTLKENYGVTSPLKNEKIKQKAQETWLKKYGVDNPGKSSEIRDKMANTCLTKYGVEHALQDGKIRNKIKKTNLKKYGTENPFEAEEIKQKIRQTNTEKYGVENPSQSLEVQRLKDTKVFNSPGLEGTTGSLANLYNRSRSQVLKIYKTYGEAALLSWLKRELTYTANPSAMELEVLEFVEDNYSGRIEKQYKIERKEIDIYLPELKLGFEVNGCYFHSDLYKDKNYHQYKKDFFRSKGINLIHIYDCDWINKKNIVKNIILNNLKIFNEKIYARNCVIREIQDVKLVREFIDENHIQGYTPGKIKLGLFHNNELVGAMTLSKPRYSKKHDYELVRFCTRKGTIILGGFSKCLKYFINTYSPKSIISYCNRDYFLGQVYEKAGFKLERNTNPGYFYIKNNRKYSRVNFQKHKLSHKLEVYDSSLTESENMNNNGYLKIYNSGNSVYTLKIKE
jgi:hypothetical protein